MTRLGTAAFARGKVNVPTGYVRLGRRVVNPKVVYGSQRDHARALYRRIDGRPGPATRPVILRRTVGPVDDRVREPLDDRIREPVNWGLVVGLLGCLSFWGAVVFGLVVAV
jgi:hypothetical protein